MPQLDIRHVIKNFLKLFEGPVRLDPNQWYRSASSLVMCIAMLKVMEIVIFCRSLLLCEYSASDSRGSDSDFGAAYCAVELKRMASLQNGVIDSCLILITTVFYTVVLSVVNNQLIIMQGILEGVAFVVQTPTVCKIGKAYLNEFKRNPKWQKAKKTVVVSLTLCAITIIVVGATIQTFLSKSIEYLKPVECPLTAQFMADLGRTRLICIWKDAHILEFIHSCSFYLSVLAAVLFLLVIVYVMKFVIGVEVSGVITYESEKFDMLLPEKKKGGLNNSLKEAKQQLIDAIMEATVGTGMRSLQTSAEVNVAPGAIGLD